MGLNTKGQLVGKIQNTSYMYPVGLFGSVWDVELSCCSVINSDARGVNEDICIVSMGSATSSAKKKATVLLLQSDGRTWSLPGPGGWNPVNGYVTFDSSVHIDGTGTARVWFGKSCIPK